MVMTGTVFFADFSGGATGMSEDVDRVITYQCGVKVRLDTGGGEVIHRWEVRAAGSKVTPRSACGQRLRRSHGDWISTRPNMAMQSYERFCKRCFAGYVIKKIAGFDALDLEATFPLRKHTSFSV